MPTLPSLFISHGAPTFALEPGRAGAHLAALGRSLPRPAAVLIVSPHWMSAEPRVAMSPRPETIHDFGGFDPALYRIQYPAPGHPALAQQALLRLHAAGWAAEPDAQQGLDHGAWVPMRHLYPQADVPVFQVSLPGGLDADRAWALGAALAPLADDGVLIVGSGSVTHNLADFRGPGGSVLPYVPRFAGWVRDAVAAGDGERLRRTLLDAPDAARAHPTTEHFWPLLVAAGAARSRTGWQVLEGDIDHGMLAMDAFVFGTTPREERQGIWQ